ncbi:DUF2786 domain-containing protein [Mesorhizobium sp. Cs1299R1N3]|uniref:DUF2786 domain-containing protein n=1 Tax=Mesorhizobium sp. Cs1299R1N3 TaxID=3015173 RepID=UPI00301D4008
MTDREKLFKRIRALAAMTVENGCTENEAVAAAGKLADMLAAHNVTLDEAMLRENPFGRHDEAHADAVGERLWKPALAVAELTGTRTWRGPAGVRPYRMTFFGFDHEVEVAKYLMAIVARAMHDGERRVMIEAGLLNPARRRMRVGAFLDGMADALHRRILALKPPTPTGTGLIVLRNALIDDAIEAAGIKLGDARVKPSRSLDADYRRGVQAGQAVDLNRGVAGPTGMQRRIA